MDSKFSRPPRVSVGRRDGGQSNGSLYVIPIGLQVGVVVPLVKIKGQRRKINANAYFYVYFCASYMLLH